MGGVCSEYGGKESSVLGFGGGPEWKRPLGRPRRSWEDNIKMDIQEVWCGGVDWIELVQGRETWQALVNAVMILRVA